MNTAGLKQRLAAILAADVAGYSRLMAVDERATVVALDAARDVFRSQIESNQGRVIDMAGDSVLAVFETATGAVSAALAAQEEINAASNATSEDRCMRFRIGVHMGDIIEKADGTVYGDGVNIAARLQALAEVGGISVSDAVHGAVRGKVTATFADQGEQQVKNIPHPVRAFAVRTEIGAVAKLSPAVGDIDLSLPDKPSIAVLPFTNMSGDPEQEYFADGVVDEIISALSRVRAFFVIARNSSFSYKGKSPDVRQVGRELGVRYVLEGSIRKAGNRVRIVGQLVEAENGRHIWADRFEGNLNDIFELQDRITESVVGAIEPHLRLAEIERARKKPTENLQAYDLCLRAFPNLRTISSKADTDEALGLLDRAIKLDPTYAYARALSAFAYTLRKGQSWASAAEIEKGLNLADEALADHRDDPFTLTYAGFSLSYLGFRHEEGLQAIDRALALHPNSTLTLLIAGWVRGYVSDASIAIEHFRRAIRLNPLDPAMGAIISGLGWAYLIAGQYEAALSAGLKSLRETSTWIPAHHLVILCLVSLGRLGEARTAANRLIELVPKTRISALRHRIPYKDPVLRDHYLVSLRAAGIPE